jgi:hypothetical protein
MPAHSPDIALKIAAIEAEMDIIHSGWRDKARFDHCAYDLKARIKWCLKRLSLLADGNDYDVMIVRDARNSQQCYAHPVLPATARYEQVTREPPSPRALSVLPSTAEEQRLPDAVGEPALAVNTDRDQLRQLTRGKRKPAVVVVGGVA